MNGFDGARGFEDSVIAYQIEARSKRVAAYAAEHGVSNEAAEAAIPPINLGTSQDFLERGSASYQWRRQAEDMRRLSGK